MMFPNVSWFQKRGTALRSRAIPVALDVEEACTTLVGYPSCVYERENGGKSMQIFLQMELLGL